MIKIAADAIFIQAKGSAEAWKKDRRKLLSTTEFMERMDHVLPGWKAVARAVLGPRKTCYGKLLENRVYKMYYSGTSDRGKKHDPFTRAAESNEHWTKHAAVDSALGRMHGYIVRGGRYVYSWEKLLDY